MSKKTVGIEETLKMAEAFSTQACPMDMRKKGAYAVSKVDSVERDPCRYYLTFESGLHMHSRRNWQILFSEFLFSDILFSDIHHGIGN
jgi:hypothetical protein